MERNLNNTWWWKSWLSTLSLVPSLWGLNHHLVPGRIQVQTHAELHSWKEMNKGNFRSLLSFWLQLSGKLGTSLLDGSLNIPLGLAGLGGGERGVRISHMLFAAVGKTTTALKLFSSRLAPFQSADGGRTLRAVYVSTGICILPGLQLAFRRQNDILGLHHHCSSDQVHLLLASQSPFLTFILLRF